ncbi:hypothetical protein [Marilutibacter aestuarii]|uniref:Uncharacterized protein n=1 Tax=Marilutibacter aestuarii TaxID=1706195 RepID=A0A508AKY4_9GAMM|nr:hypothetical protein [Lysobacter aestuarii]TQD46322.1 hypothetical protein FKV25_06640 [Lysobacter aestuarii]
MRASAHLAIVAGGLLALLNAASVQGAPPAPNGLGAEWAPIGIERLADIRGGFQLPGGPVLSFGIERVVRVNGTLVAQASVRIPDIANITVEQAQALAEFNRGLLVQVGEGNRVVAGTATGALVVQNSLDDQRINAMTRLEVGVDTLGMFKSINFHDALVDAQLGALGR